LIHNHSETGLRKLHPYWLSQNTKGFKYDYLKLSAFDIR